MKERLNVTKSEAKQIGLWGVCILNKDYDHLMITKEGKFIFEYFAGSDQDILYYEDEYKDYEWRLTEIKDLEQGNIIKCIYQSNNFTEIGVFDDYAIFWAIESNRPKKQIICTNKALELIYKLCKKSEDK